MLRRGSYYAQAYRQGVHGGKEGTKLADFVARRMRNPTKEMIDEAQEFALVNTFQDDLGRVGKMAQKTLQFGPLALYWPFMKTPINLAKFAWRRTPGLQLISKQLYDDIRIGGVKADQAIGRLTLSNLLGMFIFELAQDDLITGSGPVDLGLRKAWLLTHEPYSFKGSEGWRPFRNTEPGSTIFGLVGDFAQIWNQLDDPTAEQGAMAITFTISRDLLDKTYWRSMEDGLEIVSALSRGEQPSKKLKDFVLAPITTVVTGGPLGAAIARADDPIRRETRTFMDGLMAKTLGYTEGLPCQRDALGECILPPQAVGGPWVGIMSPLTAKPFEEDWLANEVERLEVRTARFPDNVGGRMRDEFDIRQPFPEDRLPVALSLEQRDRWQVIYRNFLRNKEVGAEAMLRGKPFYENATRAAQRQMLSDFISDSKSSGRDALLVEDTELGKKVIETDATSVSPPLKQQEQEAMQQQVREAIDLFEVLAPEQQGNLLRWGFLEPDPADVE